LSDEDNSAGDAANSARVGYAICATAGAGSAYLRRLLTSLGAFGAPGEYFNAGIFPDDPSAHVERVLAQPMGRDGVYGVEVFPDQFDLAATSRWTLKLPLLQYIFFTRDDVVGQAVWLARARQTGAWAGLPPAGEAVFDYAQIAGCLREVVVGEQRWRMFFARNGIEPLRLTYENLVDDPAGCVEAIGRLVGIDADHSTYYDWNGHDLLRMSKALQVDALG